MVGIEQLKQDGAPNRLLEAMPDRLYNRARIHAPMVRARILSARYATAQWLSLKGGPIELVSIDPMRAETARGLDTRWVPVVPNTDVALALGMMHTLQAEKLHDQKFLADYTSGFPQFLKYLTGEADGVAKTPAWAAICGVPGRQGARPDARRRGGERNRSAEGKLTAKSPFPERGRGLAFRPLLLCRGFRGAAAQCQIGRLASNCAWAREMPRSCSIRSSSSASCRRVT